MMDNSRDSSYISSSEHGDSRRQGYLEDASSRKPDGYKPIETAFGRGETPQILPHMAEDPIFLNNGHRTTSYAPAAFSPPVPRSYRVYSRQDTMNANNGRRFGADPFDEVVSHKKRKEAPACSQPESQGSSKRLAWDLSTHRSFCSAVYEIGLSHASPAVLMDRMELHDPAITSERVKSHLQKYRQNRNKSRTEFWAQYDRFVSHTAAALSNGGGRNNSIMRSIVHSILQSNDEHTPPPAYPLLGGNAAAFLSVVVHATATRPTGQQQQQDETPPPPTPGAHPIPIRLPKLTDTERESALGESLVSAFGMFQSLCRHVMHQRAQAAGAAQDDDDDDDSCSAYGGADLKDTWRSGGASAQAP